MRSFHLGTWLRDHFALGVAGVLAAVTFSVYTRTLAPSVATIFDDSLEFQLVTYQPGIAHPTGYPLYTLLGKLFTLLPVGDVAYRVNLLSAVAGGLAIGALYLAVQEAIAFGLPAPLPLRHLPALIGAMTLAFTPTFWSQATIAEVYTLHLLLTSLVLWLAVRWADTPSPARAAAVGLAFGLGLAHHRMIVLLLPGLAVFGALVLRKPLRQGVSWRTFAPGRWFALALFGPLLLYLYLPLRGLSTGSLDGTYQNTLAGFLSWVTGAGYSAFLSGNPLGQTAAPLPAYLAGLWDNFGLGGLALAACGLFWLARRGALLALYGLSFLASAGFALAYRVGDAPSFYLMSYLFVAAAAGFGAMALMALATRLRLSGGGSQRFAAEALALLPVLLPLVLFTGNLERSDRSADDAVRRYAADLLAQPLEPGAAVVGLLGEMTLIRYYQQTAGQRADLETVAADDEAARRAAVVARVEAGRPVYLTRPLPGLAERYPLEGVGPLVRVRREPLRDLPGDAVRLPGGPAPRLEGYRVEGATESGRSARLTLFWRAGAGGGPVYQVFIHLRDVEGQLIAQTDGPPLNGAYPSDRWRDGELVVDVHDLPIPVGTAPGTYAAEAGLFDPASGVRPFAPIRLEGIVVARPPAPAPLRALGLPPAQGSGASDAEVRAVGARLPSDARRPGEAFQVDLYWQALTVPTAGFRYSLGLVKADGSAAAPPEAGLEPVGGRYPPPTWRAGELVRDPRTVRLPADLPDGRYGLEVRVGEGPPQTLGFLDVRGRGHVFDLPPPATRLDAVFGDRVALLGYDGGWQGDRLDVTFYWRARAPVEQDLSVFLHLLDADGAILAQRDGRPAGGEAPTPSWLPGEVIADRYQLEAPPGVRSVRLGLYDPSTGRRLSLAAGNDHLDIPGLAR